MDLKIAVYLKPLSQFDINSIYRQLLSEIHMESEAGEKCLTWWGLFIMGE